MPARELGFFWVRSVFVLFLFFFLADESSLGAASECRPACDPRQHSHFLARLARRGIPCVTRSFPSRRLQEDKDGDEDVGD
jgi:hypothetical protein